MSTIDVTDIIGEAFNDLTVIEYVRSQPRKKAKGNEYFYLCRCKCGKEKIFRRSNLRFGHSKSCGCFKRKKGKDNPCWVGHGEISGRMWGSIKNKAEVRDLKFNITIEQVWERFQKQKGKCALSGLPLTLESHKECYAEKTASLDRIDNTKGYEKSNIQWLHKDVNWMKGKFKTERFVELCSLISNHKGE